MKEDLSKLLIVILVFLGFVAFSLGVRGGWALVTDYLNEQCPNASVANTY